MSTGCGSRSSRPTGDASARFSSSASGRRSRRRSKRPRTARGASGADHREDDPAQLLPGRLVDDRDLLQLVERLVAVVAGLAAGVLGGTCPPQDRPEPRDARRRRYVAAPQNRGAVTIARGGVLERVEGGQRLLVVGAVARLLAGAPLPAPDAEEVVVELERDPERPAEPPVAPDDRLVVGRQQRA